jgi:hypothetical protein
MSVRVLYEFNLVGQLGYDEQITAAGKQMRRSARKSSRRTAKSASSITPVNHGPVPVAGITGVEPRGALDGVTNTALRRRTNVTCIWGVNDPFQLDHGAKKGAAKWGSLTPRLPPTGRRRLRRLRHRRHRTPPTVVQRSTRRATTSTVRRSLSDTSSGSASRVERERERGNDAPAFAFPPPVPLVCENWCCQGEARRSLESNTSIRTHRDSSERQSH